MCGVGIKTLTPPGQRSRSSSFKFRPRDVHVGNLSYFRLAVIQKLTLVHGHREPGQILRNLPAELKLRSVQSDQDEGHWRSHRSFIANVNDNGPVCPDRANHLRLS